MSERLTQVTIVDKDLLELLPGEMTCDAGRKYWFIGCPTCKGPGALAKHTVTEHDGLITVSPSILCGCGAHYFIRQNKIEWC
jgi:hypothetical protein